MVSSHVRPAVAADFGPHFRESAFSMETAAFSRGAATDAQIEALQLTTSETRTTPPRETSAFRLRFANQEAQHHPQDGGTASGKYEHRPASAMNKNQGLRPISAASGRRSRRLLRPASAADCTGGKHVSALDLDGVSTTVAGSPRLTVRSLDLESQPEQWNSDGVEMARSYMIIPEEKHRHAPSWERSEAHRNSRAEAYYNALVEPEHKRAMVGNKAAVARAETKAIVAASVAAKVHADDEWERARICTNNVASAHAWLKELTHGTKSSPPWMDVREARDITCVHELEQVMNDAEKAAMKVQKDASNKLALAQTAIAHTEALASEAKIPFMQGWEHEPLEAYDGAMQIEVEILVLPPPVTTEGIADSSGTSPQRHNEEQEHRTDISPVQPIDGIGAPLRKTASGRALDGIDEAAGLEFDIAATMVNVSEDVKPTLVNCAAKKKKRRSSRVHRVKVAAMGAIEGRPLPFPALSLPSPPPPSVHGRRRLHLKSRLPSDNARGRYKTDQRAASAGAALNVVRSGSASGKNAANALTVYADCVDIVTEELARLRRHSAQPLPAPARDASCEPSGGGHGGRSRGASASRERRASRGRPRR